MITTLRDFELLGDACAADPVDETIFQSDPTGPPSLEFAAKGFWLARALERRSHAFFGEAVQSHQNIGVGLLPVEIVVPRLVGEDQPHGSMSCRSEPAPASSWAIASVRR